MKASPRSLIVRPFVVGLGAAVALLVSLVGAEARAQTTPPATPPPPPAGVGNGIGVGAAGFLSGVGGVQVDYDTSAWDVDAMLGFADRSTGNNNSQTEIDFGVRGWYHLHQGASSDFSVGGGLGLAHFTGGGANTTATSIEVGVRPRAFITSNVAIHAMLGLSIAIGDNLPGNRNTGVLLGAQTLFGAGFTYYFK